MGNKQAASKEARQLLRAVRQQGCTVERLGSGHHRISKPGIAETVTISGTKISNGIHQRNLKLLRALFGLEL